MPNTTKYYAEYLFLWGWCAAIENIRYEICGLRYEDMKHKMKLVSKTFQSILNPAKKTIKIIQIRRIKTRSFKPSHQRFVWFTITQHKQIMKLCWDTLKL